MGKNLKGKEIGKGISQRKDGLYCGGMQSKPLQMLLDHASIKTTMDRYVHVTDESLAAGVRQFEQHRQAVTL